MAKVVAFVREQAGKTLGVPPEVFALSAREALRSREQGDATGLGRSGLPAFEAKVTATLDEKERFRLKLQNPLGVARRAHREGTLLVGQRLDVLGGDLAALEAIEKRVSDQSAEMTRDFRFRLSDVEKALLEFERRGNAFFDERLRLGRFRELFDRERLRRDFEAEAVAGLPYEVERRVDGIVDWMVEAELRQWQDVMALLAERPAARPGSEGRVDDRFAYDRSRLLESVREAAREAVLHYDAPSEARRLAEKVRESVAQAALLQVSALGLGTIVAALASTTVADVTGILAAGVLSLIGLFLLPARREKARRELAAKVTAVREKLMASLTATFEAERDRAAARVREAVSPYAAFVRREKERLDEARASPTLGADLGPRSTPCDDSRSDPGRTRSSTDREWSEEPAVAPALPARFGDSLTSSRRRASRRAARSSRRSLAVSGRRLEPLAIGLLDAPARCPSLRVAVARQEVEGLLVRGEAAPARSRRRPRALPPRLSWAFAERG